MRTTVTLDPDVHALIRKAMRERGLSFKDALNGAIRPGLDQVACRPPRQYRLKTYRVGFNPDVSSDKALRLAAAIEDEEIARKLGARR